jgi:CBS domain-containing protein
VRSNSQASARCRVVLVIFSAGDTEPIIDTFLHRLDLFRCFQSRVFSPPRVETSLRPSRIGHWLKSPKFWSRRTLARSWSTDDQGSVLGILSERDIVRAVANRGTTLFNDAVSVHMTTDVITTTDDGENNGVFRWCHEDYHGRFGCELWVIAFRAAIAGLGKAGKAVFCVAHAPLRRRAGRASREPVQSRASRRPRQPSTRFAP